MDFTVEKPWLLLPLGYHAADKKLLFYDGDELSLELDAPVDPVRPDYVRYVDLSSFRGRTLRLETRPAFDYPLRFVDAPEIPKGIYKEKYRPAAHFTAAMGWINDPNGLVYYKGLYHLFFQYNPYSHRWGNMHWGHAVSRDLVHWEEREPALFPDDLGTMYSGSAVVDTGNVSGLKAGEEDPILLFYTAAGGVSYRSQGKPFTQCMAYSLDGGKTFQKYAGNSVIPHVEAENRDPKVVYVPELEAYLLALYLNQDRYAFYTSANLLDWTFLQQLSLPGDAECPDFYPLTVAETGETYWILSGASDCYLAGRFVEGKFVPTQPVKRLHYGRESYAAQSFSGLPGGRRVRLSWNRTYIPDSYFCGSMCTPCEMGLVQDGEEVALTLNPVKEWDSLFTPDKTYTLAALSAGPHRLAELSAGPCRIELSCRLSADARLTLSLFGVTLELNRAQDTLRWGDQTMPLCSGSRTRLQLMIDATGWEIYAADGRAFFTLAQMQDLALTGLDLRLTDGQATDLTVAVGSGASK